MGNPSIEDIDGIPHYVWTTDSGDRAQRRVDEPEPRAAADIEAEDPADISTVRAELAAKVDALAAKLVEKGHLSQKDADDVKLDGPAAADGGKQ